MGFTIPNKIEYGNVVIFLALEKVEGKIARKAHVGLTLTVWKHSKKPKVVSSPIDMQHCLAIRVVHMVPHLDNEATMFIAPKVWRCFDTSVATIVRPMSLVAVLDCATSKPFDSGLQVELTEFSAQTCADLDSIAMWFPEPDPEVEKPFSTMGGVAHMDRKKRGRKANTKNGKVKKTHVKKKKKNTQKDQQEEVDPEAAASGNADEGEEAPSKVSKKKTKQKKNKKVMPKKTAQPAENVIGVPGDFRKNNAGRLLIKNMMQRLKDLDDQKFPDNLCFSHEGVCRLKSEKCKNVSWKELVARSPEFFVRECHGILFCSPLFFSGSGERHIRNNNIQNISDNFRIKRKMPVPFFVV